MPALTAGRPTVADAHVDVAGLRAAAKGLAADGGPITFLENAQAELDKARLGAFDLTIFGCPTVGAHNAALDVHDSNLKGGIQRLRDAADALSATADHWAKSDEPWVVKG